MGGLESTECLTVERGHPIAMFGVSSVSFTSEKGSIWLLASDELTLIQRRFLRHSREFIDRMLGYHPMLENYCDCRNEETIKWIKWLGGEFSEPEPYGYDSLPFAKFTFKRRE